MSAPGTDDPNARWRKALAHPVRVQVLETMVGAQLMSPAELASALGIPLPNVSYHVRRLEQLGLMTLAKRTPVRGAVEHHFSLNDREATILALAHAEGLARLAAPTATRIGRKAARGLTVLGGVLRALREAQGLAVAEVAERASLTPATLRRIEQGEADPRLSVVCRIAEALDVTLLDVMRALP